MYYYKDWTDLWLSVGFMVGLVVSVTGWNLIQSDWARVVFGVVVVVCLLSVLVKLASNAADLYRGHPTEILWCMMVKLVLPGILILVVCDFVNMFLDKDKRPRKSAVGILVEGGIAFWAFKTIRESIKPEETTV